MLDFLCVSGTEQAPLHTSSACWRAGRSTEHALWLRAAPRSAGPSVRKPRSRAQTHTVCLARLCPFLHISGFQALLAMEVSPQRNRARNCFAEMKAAPHLS